MTAKHIRNIFFEHRLSKSSIKP